MTCLKKEDSKDSNSTPLSIRELEVTRCLCRCLHNHIVFRQFATRLEVGTYYMVYLGPRKELLCVHNEEIEQYNVLSRSRKRMLVAR